MQQYHELLSYVLKNGSDCTDRTETGTRSVFGYQMRFNLRQGFPLVTTKKIHFKSVIHELLWFLKGETNIKYLKENGVSIWNEWANREGELGPVYGSQWRKWKTANGTDVDQIAEVINQIKTNPNSRRLIVSAWNVGQISEMALPPCHNFFQFHVENGKLSIMFNMRSNDLFLGAPFNIASYALLVEMVAHVCSLEVGELVMTIGNAHIYHNHFEQVKQLLCREPRPLPQLKIKRKVESIFGFQYSDFELINYNPHPKITAPVAV